LNELVRTYFIIGGMPAVVKEYVNTQDVLKCQKIQHALINTFIDDFAKYARDSKHTYLKKVFNSLATKAGNKKDAKFVELVNNIGKDAAFKLKEDNYNKSLAEIVLNKMQLKKIIELDGELIQKKDPVFMEATSNFGRAQFYSSEKKVLGYVFDTFWFNLSVIWLGTFMLYIALLANLLKKVLSFIESIKFRR